MHVIDESQYIEGRAAYERGATARGLMDAAERLETTQPDNENAIPSLIVGFLEGLLVDIRAIAANTRAAKP